MRTLKIQRKGFKSSSYSHKNPRKQVYRITITGEGTIGRETAQYNRDQWLPPHVVELPSGQLFTSDAKGIPHTWLEGAFNAHAYAAKKQRQINSSLLAAGHGPENFVVVRAERVEKGKARKNPRGNVRTSVKAEADARLGTVYRALLDGSAMGLGVWTRVTGTEAAAKKAVQELAREARKTAGAGLHYFTPSAAWRRVNSGKARKHGKRRNPAGAYSSAHPKIDLFRRSMHGGKLASVAGSRASGSSGARDWHYFSTTQWYPTVKSAVAAMRAKEPGFEWRGEKQRHNPVGGLHARIAKALGWSDADVRSMSMQSLRDLVRPVDPKLAGEISEHIRGGGYVFGAPAARKRRRNSNEKFQVVLLGVPGDFYGIGYEHKRVISTHATRESADRKLNAIAEARPDLRYRLRVRATRRS